MAATVATVAYLGLEARSVEVQVQLSSGIPKFTIVGLPDKAVAESRERVRAALAAIRASGLDKGLICPAAQGSEASWAGELEVVAAPDLLALLAHLKGTALVPAPPPAEAEPPGHGPDLAQVKGQEVAKRALEIAA